MFYNLTINIMEKELLKKLKQKFMWARDRCTNPHSQRWNTYWWRWIKFLRESFEDFYQDMWESFVNHVDLYWIRETTLDRIDTNGNYCKENCRWATREQQYLHRTRDRVIIYNGRNLWNRTNVADKRWINPSTLKNRLESWWTIDKALLTQVRNPCKRIQYKGVEYKSVKEFANAFWLSYTRTKDRINKWWDLDKVITYQRKKKVLND